MVHATRTQSVTQQASASTSNLNVPTADKSLIMSTQVVITITFKGQPLNRGITISTQVDPTPPEMWVRTDTFFKWQRGAVKYYSNGVQDGYF